MSAPRSARALYCNDGRVALTFSYDKFVISEIKRLIPAHNRTYDAFVKTWHVSVDWAAVALRLLNAAFGSVKIEREPESELPPIPAPIRTTDQAYAELHLLPSAPWPVVEAAYRAMARLNHPDKGGDREQMTRVNLAYESLQRRAGAA